LPYPINFPTAICDNVRCLAEESVKLYNSAGKWFNEEVFLDRASTRLWATAFLHAARTKLISVWTKAKLFRPESELGEILATSNFFDYIPKKLVLASDEWALAIGGVTLSVSIILLIILTSLGSFLTRNPNNL
jgi:hypothetical protein